MNGKQTLTEENGYTFTCTCGNSDVDQGFHSCDATGKRVMPDYDSGWKNPYLCEKCKRIWEVEISLRKVA